MLGFVGSGHSGKTVVGYFSVDVVLIEPLHDTIQLFDALFRLNKLFVAVAHQAIEFLFVLLRDQFYKFRFMGTCISRNALQLPKQDLFHLDIVDLVGRTKPLPFLVGCAGEVLLLVFPAPRSDLVQFGSAVGTEQYSGEYRHLTDWSKSPAPVSNTLDDIECFLINDWFVGILKNRPFGRIVPHGLFALEGLPSCAEIDCMAQVFGLHQQVGYGALLPESRLFRLLCGRLDPKCMHMFGGSRNAPTHQFFRDLRRAFPGNAHFKHLPYYRGRLRVYDPMVLVIGVFQIAVRRIGSQRFAGISFGTEHSLDFFAGVFGIELVENVDERRHVIVHLIGTVYTVIDGDEADIVVWEHHLRVHTYLKIIPSQSAHILHDNGTDTPFVNHA